MKDVEGRVHSIETFGLVDGPGVRFIVFLQGCPLRCQFCHNPDTWKITEGEKYTADQLLQKALKYRSYWRDNGGITVSGGEPLLQIDFLIDLFKKAKKEGVHTTIDTSGGCFTRTEPFFSKFEELMKYTDLLLVDLKHIDNDHHQNLTGMGNEHILDMLSYLSQIHKPVWIRHVLIPEKTDQDEWLIKLNQFIQTLSNVERIDVLPYHTLGVFKWKELNLSYPLKTIEPPTVERVDNAKALLHTEDYQDK